MPQIGIILGSDSDLPKIKDCFRVLDEFSVSYEVIVASAHRTPEKAMGWASSAASRGMRAIIAVAGGAAHLPGVVAAHTTLPVIGVPIETKISGGLDSLFSIVQMPSGIPVATMPTGKAGGPNAALFAIQIIGSGDEEITAKIADYRKAMAEKISSKNEELNKLGVYDYINTIEDRR